MRPDFEDMVNRSGGNISVRDAEILYETAMEIEAKAILEIGSREGGSSMVLGSVAKETGGRLLCIEPDVPGKWETNMRDLLLRGSAMIIKQSSPWISGIYAGMLQAMNLDYLFIDGDHRTRWILTDYHYWEPSVRIGGRIAFHDWTGANGVWEQVQRAVSIILETDSLKEIVRHESTDRGIIVFEKGDK
jgi:predicted O-methyltransferase YrrM